MRWLTMTLLSSISEMSDSGLLAWVTLWTRLGLNTIERFSESILLAGSSATRRRCSRRYLWRQGHYIRLHDIFRTKYPVCPLSPQHFQALRLRHCLLQSGLDAADQGGALLVGATVQSEKNVTCKKNGIKWQSWTFCFNPPPWPVPRLFRYERLRQFPEEELESAGQQGDVLGRLQDLVVVLVDVESGNRDVCICSATPNIRFDILY